MKKILITLLTAGLLAGCGILYKQPIYQGNLLNAENVEQLREGMTRRQVAVLLGSPMVADPFHQSRWDYVATQRVGRRDETEVKNLTVFFEGDSLAAWEGEYFPKQDQELAQVAIRIFGGNLPRENNRRGRR
ncbi:outer membrane protein assembly factor BamE [Coralloluteibacterium thermophilus]|uniref:Outer membrane protein assembly factor BamE n=1 Tax=Coralloluteibacterium thermophilum TaxID=2707049 RepID=A0ABV9NKQ0_9GAMM